MLYKRTFFVAGLSMLISVSALSQSIVQPEPDPSMVPALVHQSSMRGFQTISIDGYIHQPTVRQFDQALSQAEGTKGIIYFNSNGGDIEAAMRLGRAIRDSGYAVQIGKLSVDDQVGRVQRGVCMSACPVAFFGGKYRFFDPANGPMGVHRISKAVPGRWVDDNKRVLNAEDELGDYLVEMGIDLEILDLIRKTTPNDMAEITPTQARYWNIDSKPEVWDWSWVDTRLVGTISSVTGDTGFQLWCDAGALHLQVNMKPWFPVAALLNYDEHSVTFNGNRIAVSEVRVAFDEETDTLQMITHLTPNMVKALDGTVRIGYALDYEGRRDGYHRSIPVPRRGKIFKDLTAQCAEVGTNNASQGE